MDGIAKKMLIEILSSHGAYDVVWTVAEWVETELANSLASRKDLQDNMKDAAGDLKRAANKILV